MEHIVKDARKKRNGYDLEIQRIRRANKRAENINKALTFSIKTLTLLFVFQIIYRMI